MNETTETRTYSGADFAMLMCRAADAGMGYSLSIRNFWCDRPDAEQIAVALWWYCRQQDTYDTPDAIAAIARGDADQYSLPLVYSTATRSQSALRDVYDRCEAYIIAREVSNQQLAGNEFYDGINLSTDQDHTPKS